MAYAPEAGLLLVKARDSRNKADSQEDKQEDQGRVETEENAVWRSNICVQEGEQGEIVTAC